MKRDIKKIEITYNSKEDKTECSIILNDNRTDSVTLNGKATGYQLLNSFKCSDMLGIKEVNYYDTLGYREKNILDNLSVIKKSNDFKNGYIFLSTDKEVYSQNEAFIIADNKIIG